MSASFAPERDTYLRPAALYPTTHQTAYSDNPPGLTVAGGWCAFAMLELIQRSGQRGVTTMSRSAIPVGMLWDRDWARDVSDAAAALEHILTPRARLAGVSLDRPRIMGIVNVTPDSFSDGGQHATTDRAIAQGLRLVAEGADFLDVGAESTRPGSDPVSEHEELDRLLPVVDGLSAKTDTPISVDTRKARVMREAAREGASIINDVSALTFDPASMKVAADSGLPVILMHANGDPKTMQDQPSYRHVVLDVYDALSARIEACEAAGILRQKLIIDPGIGFGKTLVHNLALMSDLSLYHSLGVPLLVGASRKRFIGTLSGVEPPADRVHGSVAAAIAAVAQGAQIVRVHDVRATREALSVWQASWLGTESFPGAAPVQS
jgi:dihydropteroate synthase